MPNPITRLWNDYSTASPESKLRVRRILTGVWLLIVAVLAIWVIRNQEDQLRQIADRLRSANRTWLAIAVVVEIASMSTVALTYHLILKRLGHPISVPWLLQLHVQRAGVNFAAPFGGAATAYTWVGRLGQKNVPGEDAVLTLALRTICVYVATLVVVVITFAVSGRPLFAVLGVIAMIAIVLLSIGIARKGQGDWKTLQRWARKLPVRFQDRVLTAIERFKEHQLQPQDLLRVVGSTLLTRLCTISLIYICIRALDVTPSVYALFIAYVSSFVAARLVPVLYGMGAIEGSLTVALQRSGVPAEVAVGAALLFRFFDFLAPSLIGLVLYAWAERSNPGLRAPAPETIPSESQAEEPEDL
jgi:phosphatidylglycerol lysyltransferase